ncbi:hypothetical protein [Palleronia sp.]|uniref:hypothetical protein n=1 Tax=Palleronia sp. TaxID=1940284 RepID=UPI0035C7EAED
MADLDLACAKAATAQSGLAHLRFEVQQLSPDAPMPADLRDLLVMSIEYTMGALGDVVSAVEDRQ